MYQSQTFVLFQSLTPEYPVILQLGLIEGVHHGGVAGVVDDHHRPLADAANPLVLGVAVDGPDVGRKLQRIVK